MKLEPLSLQDVETIRYWRNQEMECWRTSFMLTKEMQEDFYKRCCDRNSNHRYWAIVDDSGQEIGKNFPLLGMGGITYISWENSIGEITLIIDPEKRKDGIGEKAVDLLLDQAFNYLNLQTVFGECYWPNIALNFWVKITDKYSIEGERTKHLVLPNRKYWQGIYHDSLYFSIDKDDFNKIHNSDESRD